MKRLAGLSDPTRLALSLGATVAAIVAISAGLFAIGNADPLVAFGAMYRGSFGSWVSFGETLIRFAPVTLIALGLVPSLRIGLFNIGAPGQIGLGALFATLAGFALGGAPSSVAIPVTFVAAALGGALWALGPGLLRAWFRVNEILSTLVFNFLALYLLQYLLTGPLHGYRSNIAQSDPLPKEAWLPVVIDGTRAHAGLYVVLAAIVALWLVQRSPLGYRLRLFGAGPFLARQAGVSGPRLIVWTMCVGGAAAGIAGWMQVAGVDHRLYDTVADPIGYMGLFAALLGALHPVGIFFSGLVFAALLRGGESLQIGANISPEIISALVGLILLLLAARSGRFTRASREA